MLCLIIFFSSSCLIYIPHPYEEPPSPEEYPSQPPGSPSSFDISFFYDYLSPYGFWVYYPPYRYVWIPRISIYRWRPYTYGRWVFTDYGWTWISYFEWGWATFHYGRWGWDSELGWFWVPDTIWAPAWVTWRHGGFYIGWAPLPPEVPFIPGVGITSLSITLPPHAWIFIEGRYFFSPSLYRYALPWERNQTIINYTVIFTNIIVERDRIINKGFETEYISKMARTRVTKYQLEEARRPVGTKIDRERLIIYKPSLSKEESSKPKEVLEKSEVQRRVSQATYLTLDEKQRVVDIQRRELEILEKSQQQEVEELRKELEDKEKEVQSPEEKKKIREEYEIKVLNLKRSHEKEKAEIKERHEKDKKKVEKTKVKKKNN